LLEQPKDLRRKQIVTALSADAEALMPAVGSRIKIRLATDLRGDEWSDLSMTITHIDDDKLETAFNTALEEFNTRGWTNGELKFATK
jgi:hypothetical protein